MLDKRETYKLMQDWREKFAHSVKQTTGNLEPSGCADLYAFSSGYTRSFKGARAEEEFGNIPGGEFFIIPDDNTPGYLCTAKAMPVFVDLPCGLRLYCFSPDFAWTMVFEYNCCIKSSGPYFSRLEWQMA